jgi:Protein of Unknown function (DUF2784)
VLLANAVAVLHAAAVLFMLTGSLLALRRPWVLWLHVPVALTILALYATGSDCPLTTWELALRDGAGEPGYRGGFIGHYITEPLGFPIEATSTQVGVLVVAFVPNVVGYGLLLGRALRTRSRGGSPGSVRESHEVVHDIGRGRHGGDLVGHLPRRLLQARIADQPLEMGGGDLPGGCRQADAAGGDELAVDRPVPGPRGDQLR